MGPEAIFFRGAFFVFFFIFVNVFLMCFVRLCNLRVLGEWVGGFLIKIDPKVFFVIFFPQERSSLGS